MREGITRDVTAVQRHNWPHKMICRHELQGCDMKANQAHQGSGVPPLQDELSLEATGALRARVPALADSNAASVYAVQEREVRDPESALKSKTDLHTLSRWIAAHREIAELNGTSVRARPKRTK